LAQAIFNQTKEALAWPLVTPCPSVPPAMPAAEAGQIAASAIRSPGMDLETKATAKGDMALLANDNMASSSVGQQGFAVPGGGAEGTAIAAAAGPGPDTPSSSGGTCSLPADAGVDDDEMLMELGLPRIGPPPSAPNPEGKKRLRRLPRLANVDPDEAAAQFNAAMAERRARFFRGLEKHLARQEAAAACEAGDVACPPCAADCRGTSRGAGPAQSEHGVPSADEVSGGGCGANGTKDTSTSKRPQPTCLRSHGDQGRAAEPSGSKPPAHLRSKTPSGSARKAVTALRDAFSCLDMPGGSCSGGGGSGGSSGGGSSGGGPPQGWAPLMPRPPATPAPASRPPPRARRGPPTAVQA